MTPKTLRVRLPDRSPPPLVQNHERLERGTNSFIGVKYTETSPGQFGFVGTGKVEEIPYRAEYILALREGDLVAADAETSHAAGLKTTPTPNALRRPEPPADEAAKSVDDLDSSKEGA